MTVFKKVSVKERLPDNYQEVFFISNNGSISSGFLFKPDIDSDPIVCNSKSDFSELEYWLEEVELPELKHIYGNDTIPSCGCDDYANGVNEILRLLK